MLKTNKSIRSPYTMLAAGLVVSGLLVAGAAGAATSPQSANLVVSADVTNNCTITTAPLAFGAYDPIVTNITTPKTGTGHVLVTCTLGATVGVGLNDGANGDTGSTPSAPLRQLSNGATGVLAYKLFVDVGEVEEWTSTASSLGTTGTGAAVDLTVFGVIAPGQNRPAGAYTDTVVATVTF
jgi:spore coat protein U-like protein